jgi:heavy metal-binding protein
MESAIHDARTPAAREPPAPAVAGAPPDGRTRRASALVMLARVVLLSLAALALLSAFAMARDRDAARQRSSQRYVCPMHREVSSAVASDCPICGMALELVSGAGQATPDVARSIGSVDSVELRTVTQLVRAPAWLAPDGVVTAVLHRDDVLGLQRGEAASFFSAAGPGVGLPVHMSKGPAAPWDSSTIEVRFQAERAAPARRDTGWIQLAARPRRLLVVPASAVLYSGGGAYVLAAPPEGHTFTRRSVEIGRILDSGHVAELAGDRFGAIVVLSGLREGERIITGDTFFLDAERRLQESRGNPAEVTR